MALVPQGISYPINFLRQDNVFVDPVANNNSSNNPTFPYAGQGVVAWTPSDASGAGLTFTSVFVSSSVNGNMVFIYGNFFYPATVSGLGALIGGLPFTVPNVGYVQNPAGMMYAGTSLYQVFPKRNTKQFFFNQSGATVTNASLATFQVLFSFCYPLA